LIFKPLSSGPKFPSFQYSRRRAIYIELPLITICSLTRNFSVYNPGVANSFAAAPANGLNFFDFVRPGHKPMVAFEEVVLEVRAEAIADNRNVQVVYNMRQKFNLLPW